MDKLREMKETLKADKEYYYEQYIISKAKLELVEELLADEDNEEENDD